ncbi:MAG TPA: VWA domain-containing protein [Candidatus Acidoferrum sp.]|jgi:VWFA-related protein|nr:VWA domain-containing protein [Candidatus Acidoferrum sp.]
MTRIKIGIFSCLVWAALCSPSLPRAQDTVTPPPAPGSVVQSNSAPAAPTPVFRTSSRLVLLDVIVTDHHGQFIPGLKAADFTVFEDNKPQKISAFAAQVSPAAPTKSEAPIKLPPHQYTNFKFMKQEADAPVTVVLMDMLNTTGIDQVFARKQMIKFLENLPAGRPVALFVLTSKLSMVQGFSGDSGNLVAAAKALLVSPSLLLSSEAQQQQEEIGATALETTASPSSMGPGVQQTSTSTPMAPIGQAIRNALQAQESYQKLERMNLTLNALDALAQAVAGYPGRKNLIWLAAEFPITFGPDMTPFNQASNLQFTNQQNQTNHQVRDLETEAPPVRQTAALLAAARMAVYPIDVRGQVSTGTGIDISNQTPMGSLGAHQEVGVARTRQTTEMWDAHEAMSDIARETGGRAFYGTNDLKDAMSRSVEQGSSYYSIAYSPTNRDWSGKYRKIEVKAATAGAELTYRRGYYALQQRELGVARASAAMTAAMQPSVPEFTGLLLKVQVLPPDAEHKVVRIDYAVDAHDINFSDSADQRKIASVDFAVTAWDKEFKLAGHKVDTMEMTLRADAYQKVLHTGVPFHQELDLKPGTYTLRLGALDRNSHKIGSLSAAITIPQKDNPSISEKTQ